ncbi:septum formation protein Maf [Cetobacterium sp. 8H]|uniref:Maf family protein n=1 Tax=Cetobacterium sp. 8H TaxID=2759681 RepID=UPI00163D3818|nr:Maf family protein [Cetobacterium sp. 8H]MBC2851443.1 septum formation protein Maf [Cetobacterium sp. 8H]
MILASKSPRRKEILNQLGFQLEIKVKDVEEVSSKIELTDKIKDISYKKVVEVAKENRTSFVVGADTLVEINGEVLGKPNDETEAREMLKKLSGKEHRVITAYTLINLEKNINISEAVESKVFFKTISNDEIDWYIESREPMDKAGAYGIQGLGAIFVDKIEGDFFSIMGFPINHFVKTLKKLGIDIKDIQKI